MARSTATGLPRGLPSSPPPELPLRDGPLRTALKALSRWSWTFDQAVVRGGRRLRQPRRWVLAGSCRACARCCEAPTIAAGRALWFLPRLRSAWLWWQRTVNGFELVEADRESRSFVFRCTHFDWDTRRCDSYHSRPGICRDYPRALLDQPWPELFEGCGFRVRAADAARQRAVLEQSGLPPEQIEELARRMKLD